MKDVLSDRGFFTAIMGEIAKAIDQPWAPIELRSLVNSYGDTLSDGELLECLREFNAGRHRLEPLPWPVRPAPGGQRGH